jgi:RNA polymerase sigma-70 factor (ECF subfamily)
MPSMSDFVSQPFPVTRWSLISRARGAPDLTSRQALDELLRRYLPALKTHLVLTRRLDPDRADDLLQSFAAARVVEQGLLDRVGPGRGRFRTYLLHAMNNFLVDQIRAARAQKRSAGDVHSFGAAEGGPPIDPADDAPTPADAFDQAWARQVIDQAAALMREQCAREDRADIWDVFVGRVLAPALDGAEPVPYERLVARFGYATPEQASNVLMTAKRSFQRALRQVVADYCDEAEVEDELRELRAVAARARA